MRFKWIKMKLPGSVTSRIYLGAIAAGLAASAPLWYGSGPTHHCPVYKGGDSNLSAQAMPAFARKYNTDCAMCHTVYPRLNRTGYIFKRLGYRMPWEVDSKEKVSSTHPKGAVSGRDVFMSTCAPCHEGGGNKTIPAMPLKGPKFAAKYRDDTTLIGVIRNGIFGTGMPPFDEKRLPQSDMTALVEYIRSYTPGGAGPVTMAPGPEKTGSLSGKDLFEQTCATCHPGGGNMLNPSKPIKGAGFLQKYPQDSQIADIVRHGVVGTAMPAYDKDRLSDDQLSKLIPYIRSLKP